jgi:hypothetical protein
VGKAIVYCGDCGKSLREEDFEKGKAHTREDGSYCSDCRLLPSTAPGGTLGGSSARLKALAAAVPASKPPSTTRMPKPPVTTRRLLGPAEKGFPLGLVAGLVLGGAAFAAILWTVFAGSGTPKPSSPPPVPAAAPPAPVLPVSSAVLAREPEARKVEQEMAAQRQRDEAARFDQFLAQIRELMKDGALLASRCAEVEGMLAAAGKMAGTRKSEVDALSAECARKFQEVRFEGVLAKIREAFRDSETLYDRRAEVEALLTEAAKEAGPRQGEVDALRADLARKAEEWKKSWSFTLGFEPGYEKELQSLEDWKGLKYTENPQDVHGGRRALHISPGGVGAGFYIKGVEPGRTYAMSCWVKRTAGEGEAWVGFEFFDDKKRLTKNVYKFEAGPYKRHELTLKAPAGTRKLLFWMWSDGKGEYFVDDVEVVLKQP